MITPRTLIAFLASAVISQAGAFAATPDSKGIDESMLLRMREAYSSDPVAKPLRNALNAQDIDRIALDADRLAGFDTDFSHRVPGSGITDQKSSGRCWLFTGLNMLRAQMMRRHDMPEIKFSQNYNFFFDQLEKANLFLQAIIDTSDRPASDRTVDWLFANPLSDGGQFTGLSDNLMKYGVVPAEVMPETYSSEHTSKLSRLISLKLREDGLELRRMAAEKTKAGKIAERKEQMLAEIYRMLALALGQPPVDFEWAPRDIYGKAEATRRYTPQEFYKEYLGNDLRNDYVMVMNDPSRDFYRLYEIDYDRHAYDGRNWTYVNLPIEDIKKMAIESIKDSTMMYFSCDVGKYLDRERGYLDPMTYDYESLFGVGFGMNKAERIATHASASSHAMTLMAVDLDAEGRPKKWMVENSWGPGANGGHLIISDRWFDEYMFRLVVERKYVPADILKILDQKPVTLPAWDPLFGSGRERDID